MQKKYYDAYDERYKQIHNENLQWFSDEPSPIVSETINKLGFNNSHKLLELGCGEGRDALYLLEQGFDVLATDISSEAVRYCRDKNARFTNRFQILDCINGVLDQKFDFIYAVAVLHMLVDNSDRNAFYSFIRDHLSTRGTALICTMGDGAFEFNTDTSSAFELSERTHENSGKKFNVATTSCRVVNFETFEFELSQNGLFIMEKGNTCIEPDFPQMMYAIVKNQSTAIME